MWNIHLRSSLKPQVLAAGASVAAGRGAVPGLWSVSVAPRPGYSFFESFVALLGGALEASPRPALQHRLEAEVLPLLRPMSKFSVEMPCSAALPLPKVELDKHLHTDGEAGKAELDGASLRPTQWGGVHFYAIDSEVLARCSATSITTHRPLIQADNPWQRCWA